MKSSKIASLSPQKSNSNSVPTYNFIVFTIDKIIKREKNEVIIQHVKSELYLKNSQESSCSRNLIDIKRYKNDAK